MIRNKKGKIKAEYKDILQIISPTLEELVEILFNRGLTPEEIIGLIAGQATLCVGTQQVKRRIKNESD